ncbi:SRPBCC family protein [Asticcacaulis endophyticus]|uniref:Activator of HSP90 ATPase n=1 Tax=Asticcacaulis endophyticus TaxID=1395890 RepID=A0A918PVD1_9CAUL|nr:SRPBCC family protein [Asticcacaulis endophyticus]GGZ23157.1 activator of HSP90 ATPase [Asticcacaulis endophyticus]
MTRSAHHHLITIERDLAFSPDVVFKAWADPAAKAKWFSGPPDWEAEPHHLDFRVGGKERSAGGPKDGPPHRMEAVYHDIVPEERIISSFSMYLDTTLITVSLATIEFKPSAKGTKLILNEQIVFLDGSDHLDDRIHGTNAMIDMMEAYLTGTH